MFIFKVYNRQTYEDVSHLVTMQHDGRFTLKEDGEKFKRLDTSKYFIEWNNEYVNTFVIGHGSFSTYKTNKNGTN